MEARESGWPLEATIAFPENHMTWRLRLTWAGLLGLVCSCGKESPIPTPPDCGGMRLLLYASDRTQATGQYDIFIYDLEAQGFRLLPGLNSATLPDLNPTLTSDARVVAYERTAGGAGSDILLYNRCTGTMVPQPELNTVGNETDPAFSYDALRLAFVRDTLGLRRVRLLHGPTDRLIPLPALDTSGTYSDWAPAPDRTASLIAFVSDRNGNPDVFVYDRAADSLLDLPDLISDSTDTDPWLTPDGFYLCLASSRAGGAGGLDLLLYNLSTRTLVTLDPGLNTDKTERHPALNAAGDVIVFESDRTGSKGKRDVWTHTRSSGQTSQGVEQSSVSDETQPFLLWP